VPSLVTYQYRLWAPLPLPAIQPYLSDFIPSVLLLLQHPSRYIPGRLHPSEITPSRTSCSSLNYYLWLIIDIVQSFTPAFIIVNDHHRQSTWWLQPHISLVSDLRPRHTIDLRVPVAEHMTIIGLMLTGSSSRVVISSGDALSIMYPLPDNRS
jgi:hypothetical protein